MKELNIKPKKQSSKISEDELTEITIFDQFGKDKIPVSKRLTNNCVIYTRVSSKKQESGYSLDTQLKDNMEFARKNEYNVLGYFFALVGVPKHTPLQVLSPAITYYLHYKTLSKLNYLC